MPQRIIFNEEEFAKNSLSATKTHIYTAQEAVIIAKYLSTQLPEHLIKPTLIHILSLTNPQFNPTTRWQLMNIALANAALPLRSHDPVPITQVDLELIRKIAATEDSQKILFTLLVIARFNRINLSVTTQPTRVYSDKRLRCNTPIAEVFRLAKVHKNKIKEVYSEFHKFPELLELLPGKKYDVKHILPFEPIPTDESILLVHDFDNLILYFKSLEDKTIRECRKCRHIFFSKDWRRSVCSNCQVAQKKIAFCSECGRIFERLKSNQTRCERCQKEVRKHKDSKLPTGTTG